MEGHTNGWVDFIYPQPSTNAFFTVVTLKHQLTEAKKQLTKKRDFFDGFCDLFGECAVKWSGESTDPILINGKWTSVYKPKISSRTFTFAYPLSWRLSDIKSIKSQHCQMHWRRCWQMSIKIQVRRLWQTRQPQSSTKVWNYNKDSKPIATFNKAIYNNLP